MINYLNLKQLVIKLGMISESGANSDSTERTLLYDLWKILEGEEREEVNIDDVKVLIMAILKNNDHKRIGVEATAAESKSNEDNKIGHYNDKDHFCLSLDDLSLI
jgi:hypothetical protein